MSQDVVDQPRSRRGGARVTVDGTAGSLRRAAPLLRAIAQDGGAGASISDLIARTHLPRGTIYRVLDMLADVGWIERDGPSRRYYLSQEMIAFGTAAAARHPIERVAATTLAKLASDVGQPIYLMVRTGFDGVCVARHESGATVQALVLKVGSRVAMGRGSSTVAIMAALPDSELDEIISANQPRYRGEMPAIDEALLRQRIAETRVRGYAQHDGMFVPGLSGIGVAVCDPGGHPIAGVSTAFVSEWLNERQRAQCAKRLAEAAARITNLYAVARKGNAERVVPEALSAD
jgi:DNA-binding IclR family transcriptional regulator